MKNLFFWWAQQDWPSFYCHCIVYYWYKNIFKLNWCTSSFIFLNTIFYHTSWKSINIHYSCEIFISFIYCLLYYFFSIVIGSFITHVYLNCDFKAHKVCLKIFSLNFRKNRISISRAIFNIILIIFTPLTFLKVYTCSSIEKLSDQSYLMSDILDWPPLVTHIMYPFQNYIPLQ